MMKSAPVLLLALCLRVLAGQTASSTAEPKVFYQLTYVLNQVEGDRVINTRTYTTLGSTHAGPSSIRSGEKVPFATGEGGTTSWQQIDVGVVIDSRDLEISGDRVLLRVTATVDSIASHDNKNTRQPAIRNTRWDAFVSLPLKRPVILFSSDDPFSTQKIQLQLTIVPTQ